MNIFDKLPFDVCLSILKSFSNFREAAKLSFASPTLFRYFLKFKTTLHRHYMIQSLNDSLIQDAVAIITFPRPPTPLNKGEHEARVFAHLEKWGNKSLPDPTSATTYNASQIRELNSLFEWIWVYVDDYLAKATSDYLPLAYYQLPKWSPVPRTGRLSKVQQENPHFKRNTLTAAQRDRILQAFLRYELLCRVYGPMGTDIDFMESNRGYWNQLLPGEDPARLRFRADQEPQNDPLRYWNWDLLDEFESGGSVYKNTKLLPCIREYILILHEVLILSQFDAPAQRGPSWRDHAKMQHFSQEHFMPFCGSCPMWDHLYRSKDEIASLLAAGGLDILTGVLTVGLQRKNLFDLKTDMEQCSSRLSGESGVMRFRSYTRIGYDWHPIKFVRLYQQRAGPLFGKHRPGPKLPTSIEYAQTEGFGPDERCRGGWRIDRYSSRSEVIGHGSGIWASRALEKLREPFWKVELPRSTEE